MSAREKALLHEVEALRRENEHLRHQFSIELNTTAPLSMGLPPELPLPLENRVEALSGDSLPPLLAQLDYEALLAALSSVFPIGIFRIDSTGALTHVDQALQRIFSLESRDFQAFGWMKRVHPDDVTMVREAWIECIERGAALSLEFRLQHPDGRVTHVLTRNAPIRNAQSQVVAHHGFVQDISSLRALQADAQIKDQLNRQIIESSPDCTKILDLEGRVIQMTATGCRLMAIDHFEEVRGTHWAEWWKEESRTMAMDAIRAAARRESTRFVAFAETFKGTPKWWDTVVTPICNADGAPVMLMAVSRDISDLYRQKQEIQSLNDGLESRVLVRTQELAEANERISQTLHEAQTLYDQAPCGYHSIDAQGVFVRMNRTELDWLGYTQEEVIGRLRFRDLIPPDQIPMLQQRLQRLKSQQAVEPIELSLKRSDGREICVLLSSTAVYDSDGRFVHTNNTVVDISVRQAAEEALARQRSLLQTITNSVPVQLALYDRELICRFANISYARWMDNDPQALLGRHLRDIARPQDYAQGLPHLQRVLDGETRQFEGERVLPDGHRFYASVTYTPYVNNGVIEGLLIQMLDITDRHASEMKVAEANMHLSEALTQSQNLYNHAPCGYHSLDDRGVYAAINDTELSWLGYEREEVVGKLCFWTLIPSSRQHAMEERLKHLIRDGVVENIECEIRRKDGTLFPALLSSAAVRDAEGQFLRSNTTVVNITERKAAEMALRESQRFMYTITDHVPGVIAYIDNTLRFRFANAEHINFYGLHPNNMIGQLVSECLPPDIWAEVQPRMHAAINGELQRFESWRSTPDGEPFYISSSYMPDVHEGTVKGLFVQVIDITPRKRIEERMRHLNEELELRIQERSAELLESDQRFRLMVDNLRDYCIFFLDPEGRVTDWTDSAQRMEGHSPTEVLGRHYSLLFRRKTREDAQISADRMLRAAASRGQHEQHGWYERKDGSQYWSHSVLIALRDDHGELRGFAKINRDMSDAKRLDDLMRNINDELENRVADRTEQLLAANKDLESFSYSVSHDLRSPLRHISSFVSLLDEHLREQGDEVTQRYLTTISNSARHMSQLIDGLLAFSRLGRSAVNLAPVDFSLLVDAVVSQIAHDTEGRVVDWVIAPDLPVVQGDALLLHEVWANLLGNALKYTRPRERARIEISWSADSAVGYTFAVKDNGVGFDVQYAQKLFGVFQRMHRASEFEGTGIGLALTRRILERHGGSIWAESESGQGSVFHFSLPFEGITHSDFLHDTTPIPLEP